MTGMTTTRERYEAHRAKANSEFFGRDRKLGQCRHISDIEELPFIKRCTNLVAINATDSMCRDHTREGGATGDECPSVSYKWISLDEAMGQGMDLAYVMPSIGPRRVGTVYRSGYWDNVRTVVKVDVRISIVTDLMADTVTRNADSWMITEYSADDHVRDRCHMTSWEYHTRNTILQGPGDTRPRHERGTW